MDTRAFEAPGTTPVVWVRAASDGKRASVSLSFVPRGCASIHAAPLIFDRLLLPWAAQCLGSRRDGAGAGAGAFAASAAAATAAAASAAAAAAPSTALGALVWKLMTLLIHEELASGMSSASELLRWQWRELLVCAATAPPARLPHVLAMVRAVAEAAAARARMPTRSNATDASPPLTPQVPPEGQGAAASACMHTPHVSVWACGELDALALSTLRLAFTLCESHRDAASSGGDAMDDAAPVAAVAAEVVTCLVRPVDWLTDGCRAKLLDSVANTIGRAVGRPQLNVARLASLSTAHAIAAALIERHAERTDRLMDSRSTQALGALSSSPRMQVLTTARRSSLPHRYAGAGRALVFAARVYRLLAARGRVVAPVGGARAGPGWRRRGRRRCRGRRRSGR